jgi:glycosyltransferase involved in cell wall biosynthesis
MRTAPEPAAPRAPATGPALGVDGRQRAPRAGEPLRVCHLIHALGPGGAEHVLTDLAAAAPAAGLRLSVITMMAPGDPCYPKALRSAGVPVRSLGLRTRWDPRALPRAAAAVRRLRPDLLHTHLKHADLAGAFVRRRLGIPMISTLHLVEDDPTPLGLVKRWMAGQARMRMADRTLAVSDAVRRWYLDALPSDPARVVTVRNGVTPPPPFEPGELARLRAELGVEAGQVMAVAVGLLRQGKGHADLVRAAAQVPRSARLSVVLVGDGPLRSELEAMAAAAGLPPGRLRFAGYRTDVAALLAAADLVVQPSHVDALPTTLIEALAAGRPAVASRTGGIVEIVTDETGILVPPGRPELLAHGLAALAGDRARRQRMGRAARRRFEQEFDAVRWAGRLRAVYDEVLADGGRPRRPPRP